MKFEKVTVNGTYNILYNDHYVAKPIVVDVSGGAVKAGTPLAADGTVATTADGASNAVGILLHDVTEDNPNGALVIHGFIDTAKAEAHSGVTIDDATKTALTTIKFC